MTEHGGFSGGGRAGNDEAPVGVASKTGERARDLSRGRAATMLLSAVAALASAACTAPPSSGSAPVAQPAPAVPLPVPPPAHSPALGDAPGKRLPGDGLPGVDGVEAARPPTPDLPAAAPVSVPIEVSGGVAVISTIAARCPAGGAQPFSRLIASPEALESRLAAAGVDEAIRERLRSTKIDWAGNERLLLIYGGSAPNPGYGLVIDAIERPQDGRGNLTVRAHLQQPLPGRMYAQVIVYPCQLVHLRDAASAPPEGEVALQLRR